MKEDQMGEACGMCGVEEWYIPDFGGKTWRNEPLGRRSSGWEDNIKLYLKGAGPDDVDWTHLSMQRGKWWAVATKGTERSGADSWLAEEVSASQEEPRSTSSARHDCPYHLVLKKQPHRVSVSSAQTLQLGRAAKHSATAVR